MRKAKCSFFSDFVETNSDNQGKLFRAIKGLLIRKDTLTFPGYDKAVLVNELGKYFVQKISNIRSDMDNGTSSTNDDYEESMGDVYEESPGDVPPFDTFELLSEDDVRRLIMNSRKKSCCLDPMPTDLDLNEMFGCDTSGDYENN